MFSNNNHILSPNICFPFPIADIVFLNSADYEPSSTTKANTCRGGHDAEILTTASGPILATSMSTLGSPKLQGKIQRSAVNGTLSIASILANAFQLHGFPRGQHATNHAGKLGLTFSQIDIISKRLTLVISSLALLPGSDSHVSTNNDGDAVVMIILEDEEYVDERLIVLIIAILRVGAAYMVVSREQVTSDQKYWQQLVSLIEPILVVTMIDPIDLPTGVKNDLNLFGREHFDDCQTDDDLDDSGGQLPSHPMIKSLYESETGSTTEVNPFQSSSLLVKKIRSSIIMKPSTYLKSPTVSCKVLWDLAMELKIVNEKDLIVPPFRSDAKLGERTAFIFQCDCKAPHSGVVQQWCKIGHKAIRNRISWERIEFPIKNTEKICLTFPLTDLRSLVQIFNCFIHGKVLIIGEPGEFQNGPFLLRKLSSDAFKNVQRIELTPDRLEELLECAALPNQEYYLSRIKIWVISTTSSSSLTPAIAKQFFAKVKPIDVMLIITYGAPETMYCNAWNMFSSLKELNKCMHLDKDGDWKLFLGTAAINTSILVIDSRKSTICPAGHRGEICVLGSMIPVLGYCGSTILGKSISIFQTGDIGRFVQDKGGNLQLLVESSTVGEDSNRKYKVEGKIINLDDLAKTAKQSSVYVREAYAFVCQRGKDTPEIILAVALKDQTKFDIVQEVISTKLTGLVGPLLLKCFPMAPPMIPRIMSSFSSSQGSISGGGGGGTGGGGPVDVKSVRAAYFKYLGRSNPRDWHTLFPAKGPGGRNKNPSEEQIEKSIQIICKAVAFSLGISLGEAINNFENSFWDLGGTPIKAILTVKSCLCQGKRLGIEDFMQASKVSELGFRIVYAEKNEAKWFYDVEVIRKMYSCNMLSNILHEEIHDILVYNFSKMLPLTEHKQIEKYAAGLIEAFDNSLTVVISSSETHEILGVAFNYRGPLKPHFVPAPLEEGLELYNSMLQSCRHMTQGVEIKNIAKCFMMALKTEALVHPSQVLLITRDLIKESLALAEGLGCKGYLLCTMDPLVQEICCSLLGFEVLDEIQLNLYRNKKYLKPFAHLDDHQVFGVYFAKFNT